MPLLLVGLGGTSLTTDRSSVQGATRFTFAIGADAKYNMGKHSGLRGQFRYAPTYLTTRNNDVAHSVNCCNPAITMIAPGLELRYESAAYFSG